MKSKEKTERLGCTHVALIVDSLVGGGSGLSTLETARALLALGHQVDIVLFNPWIDYPQEIPPGTRLFIIGRRPEASAGEAIDRIFDSALWLNQLTSVVDLARLVLRTPMPFSPMLAIPSRFIVLKYASRLASYCAVEKPTIIFTNDIWAEVTSLAISALNVSRTPVVPVVRNVVRSRKPLWDAWRRRLFSKASHIVAVSRGLARYMATEFGLADDAISVIYNPFRMDEIARRGEEEPDHPWFSDGGPPVVLGAGRLVNQKDFPTLIGAFERVAAERPCRLIILGEGRERRALEALIRDRSLEELVSLPGWKANPFAYMSRSALFVLSSRNEGFGRVLVEAMVCGCPTVSTDCLAGPAEILRDPSLLTPVGDADALAATMARVLDNPLPRNKLLARAGEFTAERTAQGYEEVIARVMSS